MPRGVRKVVAENVPSAAPLDDEGFYCIKGEPLWKYRAHQAEFDTIQHKLLLNKQAIRAVMEANPELKRLFEEQAELLRASSTAMTDLSAVNTQIEKMLGVSLKNCGIDDKTGRVHELSPDGTSAPLGPVKKSRRKTK